MTDDKFDELFDSYVVKRADNPLTYTIALDGDLSIGEVAKFFVKLSLKHPKEEFQFIGKVVNGSTGHYIAIAKPKAPTLISYHYLVLYAYNIVSSEQKISSTIIILDKPISSDNDISEIASIIKKRYSGLSYVEVLTYVLITS
ncbi:MAG: hypothetical protein WCP93_02755 [Candidatus Berkelbacteria bacterium]